MVLNPKFWSLGVLRYQKWSLLMTLFAVRGLGMKLVIDQKFIDTFLVYYEWYKEGVNFGCSDKSYALFYSTVEGVNSSCFLTNLTHFSSLL